MAEMQNGSKRQCKIIYSTEMPFSELVCTVHFRWRAYQGLVKLLDGMTCKSSNLFREAIKAGIPAPCLLTRDQCLDGVEACTRRLKVLKVQSGGLRKVHLRDCLIKAQGDGDKARSKGILRTIKREEQKSVWWRINQAIDKPSLGAIPLVQKMEDGEVIDITETEEMNKEIQDVTEKRFDLSMSAPITMSSLHEKLGFLSDTNFAISLLQGDVHIPDDVDNVTTMVIEEIIQLFQTFQEDHAEVNLGESKFWYYWRKFRERTSSSIPGAHAGHYTSATISDMVTNFLSRKITLIVRGGCPPKWWGHGLQILLKKVAGVALVNKLHAILLMEANFNYMNKWVFGYQAVNKMYALGYIPGDQDSQKESTAEDACMDNQLTMDISRQLRHPLATMSADSDKCNDRINHIIISLLFLAIIGLMGPMVAMLHPIQTMKFFQRTARGDSTMFMGGRGRDDPLQVLCQGNGAAPACWLTISSLLMHGYRRKGFGSRILSPMSGVIIDFLGKMYVDDTDLIVTCPDLVSSADIQ